MNLNIKVFAIFGPGSRRYTRVFLLLIILFSLYENALSQDRGSLFVDETIELDKILSEISGITYVEGKIYSINDSGNGNYIHILQASTLDILTSKRVKDSRNIDWEEITNYNNFLYIGDFGNNFGSRNDLVVYKIPIDSLLKEKSRPEKIIFSYKKQKSFSLTEYKRHPWDCEAMIVDKSGIWLFSKDWMDRTCRLYHFDDNGKRGKQMISPVDSLKLGYLVTGAYYDRDYGQQYLCGYEGKHTYVTIFKNVDYPTLSGSYRSYIVEDLEYAQVESIFVKDNLMYLASERTGNRQSVYILPLPESGQ